MSVKIAADARIFLEPIPAEFAGPVYRAECQYRAPDGRVRFEILRVRATDSALACRRLRVLADLRHPTMNRADRPVLVAFALD